MDRELRFVRSLAEFLRQHHSVGLVDEKLVRSSLFGERAPVTVTLEEFEELGWKQLGLSLEQHLLCSLRTAFLVRRYVNSC